MEFTKNKVLGDDVKNSFDILKTIIDRGDEVIENDSDTANFKLLNYYKIMIKCAIFSNLSNFNCFNFGCINFNKQAYCSLKDENIKFSPQSSVFLVTETSEVNIPYGMIGLKYDNANFTFVPETLFAPINFPDFFTNQEILKLSATNEEKLYILKMYKYIIGTFNTNSIINLCVDYENMLQSTTGNTLTKKIK